MSCSIPIINEVIAYYHKAILIEARIQGVIDFTEKKKLKGLNKDDFQLNGIFYTTSYKILKSSNLYTLKNNPTRKKTKDQKKL